MCAASGMVASWRNISRSDLTKIQSVRAAMNAGRSTVQMLSMMLLSMVMRLLQSEPTC